MTEIFQLINLHYCSMTTRPHPKQLATGTPEDGYTVQYSSGDSIWIPTTNSVFGRTGDVVATTDDYSASQIDNDSSVSGAQVSDALEYLDGYIKNVSLLTVSGDLSGNLPNPLVTDLSISSEEQGSVLYFDGSNWVQLPPGTDGYILTTHGNNPPTWEESSGGPGGSASIVVMTTPGTTSVEIPESAKILRITCGGAGGGGTSGSRGADYATGGNGGGGGGYTLVTVSVEELLLLGSSISCTVGAGGNGGAAVTSDDTSENYGDPGGDGYVEINGTIIAWAQGGQGGPLTGNAIGDLLGQQGADSTGADNGIAPYTSYTGPFDGIIYPIHRASGGGSGGGVLSDTSYNGGSGGFSQQVGQTSGAAGGTAPGGAGTSGGTAITTGSYGGRGGGGGASNYAGVGGAGGHGQSPGGGGGGGAGSINGYNSGAGGDGGDGLIVLEWI